VTDDERQKLAPVVLGIAERAATLIARAYEEPILVSYKAKDDPVTSADREANALISSALAAAFPNILIVAEESDPATYAGYHRAELAWFVDPLDGTRDFVKKNGEFAVMIGLAENGRSTLGVIVMPVFGPAPGGGGPVRRAFVGGVGVTAFESIRPPGEGALTRPLHVSSVKTLAEAELLVSRSRLEGSLEDAATRFGVRKITRSGSAGVKAARVAVGDADVYAQPSHAGKLWDSCAPEAIVVAAGGRVSDARGKVFDYQSEDLDNRHGFLVTNGHLHAPMLARLRVPDPI
jgi:3'(2'), 5'-bisphosphate nucleotidase